METSRSWRDVTSNLDYWKNRTAIYDIDNGTRQIAMIESRDNDLPTCGGRLYGRPWWGNYPPFGDLYHFAGPKKPWNNIVSHSTDSQDTPHDNWWHWLRKANETLSLGLPSNIEIPKGNPLGLKDKGGDVFDLEAELPRPMTQSKVRRERI